LSKFSSEISDIFSQSGPLSGLPEFEFRRQQQEMAERVAESIECGTHAIIEAPTGVGKSFAYLIPAIIFARQKKRKAVISTCTINLQEQLINKDIPLLRRILPYEFTSEILKGRNNYICTRRLNAAMTKQQELFDSNERSQLREIYNFVQKHNTGTFQDLPFKPTENLWSEISAEQGICTSKSCGTSEDSNCFYQQAKARFRKADVIVLNHYLLFTLLGLDEFRGDGYIFADDFLIMDEAHLTEQIAARNVSPSVSKEMIRFWLNKLYNPRTEKGFLLTKRSDRLIRLVKQMHTENDYFFSTLESKVAEKYNVVSFKNVIRIREPIIMSDDFDEQLVDVGDELKKMLPTAKNSDEENEIRNYWTKFVGIRTTLNEFLNQTHVETALSARSTSDRPASTVYWIEFSKGKRKNVKLCTSPLDMADFFRNHIFTEEKTCIMTSATLSVNKRLDFFKRTVGAEHVPGFILDSPFDYARQMKIYVAGDVPVPKVSHVAEGILTPSVSYERILIDKISEYILKTNGGALVLFTNVKMLQMAAGMLSAELGVKDIKLFVQGDGMPNNKLLNEFRKNHNSVLFGVDSFWMGVDVPGESLRNVIITKLPFEVPDDPITEAKMEAITERGGNAFYELSLPNAILKFKQGAGRLIRNKTDEGILVVLDSRILSKSYGKWFINSLPECEVRVE
jgi:ATP-dependent DNA helicase DinG